MPKGDGVGGVGEFGGEGFKQGAPSVVHVGSSFDLSFVFISSPPQSGIGARVISATMALIRQPAATNSAPRACAAARNSLPAASMKVTPVKSKRRMGSRGAV